MGRDSSKPGASQNTRTGWVDDEVAKRLQNSTLSALDAKEIKFVYLLADVVNPIGIAEAGDASGFSGHYAYEKARSPKMRAALDELLQEREEDLRRETVGVLAVMARQARSGDVPAAKVYLDAMGRGASGVKIGINMSAEGPAQFGERVKRVFGERGVLGVVGADEGVVTLAAKGNGKHKANGNGDGSN